MCGRMMSVFRFGPDSINHQVDSDSHESDMRIYAEAESRQSCFANLLFGRPARLTAEHEGLAPRLVMCSSVEYKRDGRKRGAVSVFPESVSKRRSAPADAAVAAAVPADDDSDGDHYSIEEFAENDIFPIVEEEEEEGERKVIEVVESQQPMSHAEAAVVPDEVPCEICGYFMRNSMVSCPACEPLRLATNVVPDGAVQDEQRWICHACTFQNNMSTNVCEVCSKERTGERYGEQLARLREMGFIDTENITSLLLMFDGDVERVLNGLI